MSDPYIYVPEAGASLDAFIRAAAEVAAREANAEHTALTTSAHGGIVAGNDPRLTNSRDPNAHGHAASGISTLPTGDVAATNVQQAISELDAEKQAVSGRNTANGYLGLNASGLAPPERIGSGTRDGTRILRDDGTWVAPATASSSGGHDLQDDGAPLAKRSVMNFAAGIVAQDDSVGGKTVISVPPSGPMTARTRKAAYICGGTNGTKTGITTMNTRHVIRLAAKTTRWRLRIANYNIRDEVAGGNISLTSIHTGLHKLASDGSWTGFMQPGILDLGVSASMTGGAEFVTPWVSDINHQFGGDADRVISIGFTADSTSVAIATSPNKSFQNTSTNTTSTLEPAALALAAESPLSIVVEYEFQGEQEVGLFMGDSITDGAVTRWGVASNYANQFAMTHDCLSIVHAAGGSQAQDWVLNGYKWNRLPLSEMSVDFAVISIGSNDLGGGGRTAAQLQADIRTIITRLKGLGIRRVYLGRITPRRDPATSAGWDTTKEANRKAVNDWMGTLPHDTWGAIFFDHAVRDNQDETLLAPEFLTDILHPDTAGHGRMAAELAHVLKGSARLAGPQGERGIPGPEGAGAAQHETRRYVATPFSNTTFSKSAGFDTAVRPDPQIVIPALGQPPAGYAWRVDVEGLIRYSHSVAGQVGFCVGWNGAVSQGLIGMDTSTANSQDVVPLSSFGMIPPSVTTQQTLDFTAYAASAGNMTIYLTPRPRAVCYLVAV